jgi:predicted DNA-binding protein (UPF0278 family)
MRANLLPVFAVGQIEEELSLEPIHLRDCLDRGHRCAENAIPEDDARAWHLMCRALGSELTLQDLGIAVHEQRGRHRREQAPRGELDSGAT